MDAKKNTKQNFQVILLAGGMGLGMYPFSEKYPKPLLPIGNKPMIAYPLEYLEKSGYSEVIVIAKHSHILEKYLKSEFKGNIKIDTKIFDDDNFTMVEALKSVWHKIYTNFIVISCDILTDFNLEEITDFHLLKEATISILYNEIDLEIPAGQKKKVSRDQPQESQDILIIDENCKKLLKIANTYRDDIEKSGIVLKKCLLARHPCSTIRTNFYDSHIYVFNYSVMDYLKRTKRNFEDLKEDLISFLVKYQYNKKVITEFYHLDNPDFKEESETDRYKKNQREISVYGYFTKNVYCKRVKTLNDYMASNIDTTLKEIPKCLKPTMNNDIIARKYSDVDTGESIKHNDSLLGEGTLQNSKKATISRSVIGKNCILGDNVKVANSIIMSNVTIGKDSIIQNSIIGNKVQIGEKCKIKDNCYISHNSNVQKETALANETVKAEDI